MRKFSGYPRAFYPFLVLVQLALLASGLLLVPSLLTFRLALDSPLHIAGELRLGGAALHCLLGFITLILVGALASIHMRAGWVRKANRASGLTLNGCLALLALSAVGIYYFGDESYSLWSSLTHSIAGVLWPLVLVYHGVQGYRYRRQRQR
jgi:hypothetical protein